MTHLRVTRQLCNKILEGDGEMAEMALASLLEVSGVLRKEDAPPIFLNEKQMENSAKKKKKTGEIRIYL